MTRIRNSSLMLIVIASIIPRPGHAQEPVTTRREAIKGWVGVAYTTSIGQQDASGQMVFKDYPVIESIEPNSPAEKAGLEAGDTIIAMNAQDLRKSPLPMAAMIQPGRRVVFRYKRGDVVRDVTVTVAQRPPGNSEKYVVTVFPSELGASEAARGEIMRRERVNAEIAARVPITSMPPLPMFPGAPRSLAIAGAEITALSDELRSLTGLKTPGLLVLNVAIGTPAYESGLRSADVITRAGTVAIRNPGDLIRLLEDARVGSIRLNILRMKKPQTITLRW